MKINIHVTSVCDLTRDAVLFENIGWKKKKEMTVLVVDDEPAIRKLIRSLLKDMNVRDAIEAKDGEDAISILKKEKVGLIVADWRMPRFNGLQLLEFVRSSDNLKHLPFVMITSAGDQKDIITAMQAKVSQYIIKPFTADTFRTKLSAVLK